MTGFRRVAQEIRAAETIVIAGHINPDGDSIGSLLSLGLGLRALGKKVFMVSPDGVPERYRFLPGALSVKERITRSCDLAISVDCSNKVILGPAYECFKSAKKTLAIDHHEFRKPFAHTAVIDKKAAAVGEIVFALLKYLGIKIDGKIAMNLLTSIIVETNSFRLPNYRAHTFAVCAELLAHNVNIFTLSDKVYWSRSPATALLLGICLSRIKFLGGGKVAWSIVRKNDFRKTRGKDEDIDMAADEIRAIEGVRIAVVFREKDNRRLRLSLRSKGRYNVARIAEHFGGGGHFDVAGCNIPDTISERRKVLKEAVKLLKKVKKRRIRRRRMSRQLL